MLMFFDSIRHMDDDRARQQVREQDEQSTQSRAAILGLPYLDTRPLEDTLELTEDVLDVQTMHKNRIVPLLAGGDSHAWEFGITTQTPQSVLSELHTKYAAQAQNVAF